MFKSRLAIGNNRASKRRMKRFAWALVALVLLAAFIATIPAEQVEISEIISAPEAREVR
jgi:hypothetical protein